MGNVDSDPLRAAQAETGYDLLKKSFPRDRLRGYVQAYHVANPMPDAMILPDTTPEELEAELSKMFDGSEAPPPEAAPEIERLKQMFRDVRGKKFSEIPVTPEELAAELESEVDDVVNGILSGWINVLDAARRQTPPNDSVALTASLEPEKDIRFGHAGAMTWREVVAVNLPVTPEQVGEAQGDFAAWLKPLIDAAPDGYALWADAFTLKREGERYVLLPSRA